MREETTWIGLVTDFGDRDPYVAAMRGVIAALTHSRVVDLTHAIGPQGIAEAAWFLRATLPWLPGNPDLKGGFTRAIIVCVVDPSVGTERRIIAASRAGQVVIAPDNGVLTFIAGEFEELRSVENEALFLPRGSATFHGRDRFAPVAAALANGASLESLGPTLGRESLATLDYTPPVYERDTIRGTIVAVDRFGNAITDIAAGRLDESDDWEMRVGGVRVRRRAHTYVEGGASNEPFMIEGSQGTIEVSVDRQSAAAALHIEPLDAVEIRKRK
ncbi:MAG: SAM hydrolase/SAM-dependent halogenase family protein [Thermoanaerobaculia bacterium]